MKTKSTNTKPNLQGFTQANGKTTSMVFKAFCYNDFCPVQSISTLSKGVINKLFWVSFQKPTSIRMTPSERDKGHPTEHLPGPGEPLNPHPAATPGGSTPKTRLAVKKNLSVFSSYFQLRRDFQQGCADTVAALGTRRPAGGVREPVTHMRQRTHLHVYTSMTSHWTLSRGWDYLFFYRFSKINLALFFFLYMQARPPNNCLYLCTSKETCN